MNFEDIDKDLLEAFPELSPAHQKLLNWWGDEKPGQYILFEDLFAHFIGYLLVAPVSDLRTVKLKAVFKFLERMLGEGGDIMDLGFISMLEGKPYAWLQAYKPYLGQLAESELDEHYPDWRVHSSNDPLPVKMESDDLYGIEEIVHAVISDAA